MELTDMAPAQGEICNTDAGSCITKSEDRTTEEKLDLVYGILSNARRRYVLHYLRDMDGHDAELRRLSEIVACIEHGKELNELRAKDRRAAYVALQQVHLPKLDDKGIVDFNSDRGLVCMDDMPELLEKQIDDMVTHWDCIKPNIEDD